jgi:hypothetical protein
MTDRDNKLAWDVWLAADTIFITNLVPNHGDTISKLLKLFCAGAVRAGATCRSQGPTCSCHDQAKNTSELHKGWFTTEVSADTETEFKKLTQFISSSEYLCFSFLDGELWIVIEFFAVSVVDVRYFIRGRYLVCYCCC